MRNKTPDLPQPELSQPHRAGDTQAIPGGRITYLAPLPLSTGQPPLDMSKAVSELNDTWLDFGGGWPNVFGWQMITAGWCGFLLLCVLVFPALVLMLMPSISSDNFFFLYRLFFWSGLVGGAAGLFLMYIGHYMGIQDLKRSIPVRFNRQRREVCFTLTDTQEVVFVPWESLMAWVVEARGATQYGVQQQYGMGVGYAHPETGKWLKLEYVSSGLPLAISNWEAIRAYMDYEVHSLHEIQDPHLPRGKDDPPWEGVHTLRNARRGMRERRAKGEVGPVFAFFWYAYHVIELWNLPGYLTEWEAKRLMKSRPKLRPAQVEEWSKPLPKEQWAKPSEELVRLSAEVRRLREENPHRSIEEIFADAYRSQGVVA
ncbi:hypothetical protein LY622_05190 [Halomonas sp. M5N1S17]|uniref:hypothetical protein n=1 Tax=Halomonas alkalisoli TaxID=2907158 RepID=UPI001F47AB22|nr:hypothetical protein [Halomonas alkalisoli]MCE9662827.1 hypothetical protein [Halomonas alkalisoli]